MALSARAERYDPAATEMLERCQLSRAATDNPLAPWHAIENVTPCDEAVGAPASTNLVASGGGGGGGGGGCELIVTLRVVVAAALPLQ